MRMQASLGALLILGACGEAFSGTDETAQGGSGGDLSTTPCPPGRSLSCVGKGQCYGFQECNFKGTGYGSCQCDGESGGAPGASGGAASSSGGSAPEAGADPGGAGGPAQALGSYIYWTSGTTALIQTLDPQNGEVTGGQELPAPDPNATPIWAMRSFVPLADGTARALWTRESGVAELWTLNERLEKITTALFQHDPPATFFGSAYRRLSDGGGRLVWHNNATSVSYVWPLSAQDSFLDVVLGYEPAEGGDWLPVHYTTMPDGRGLMLWAGVVTGVGPSGQALLWIMADDEQPLASIPIEHTKEQWARSLTIDPDGAVRLGLGSNLNGAGVVCGLTEIEGARVTLPTAEGWGPGKCKSYAQSGMQFRGYVARWQ